MLHAIVALPALLLSTTFPSPALADIPYAVHSMAYTTVDEKTFYIQGGNPDETGINFTNQFYALDLTQPTWDTSSPPWRALATGAGSKSAPKTSQHFMTVSESGRFLVVWSPDLGIDVGQDRKTQCRATKYSIPTGQWLWQQGMPDDYMVNAAVVRSGATDPATNLLYIPGGYNETNMAVYDLSAVTETTNNSGIGVASFRPMATPLANGVFSGFSAVWSDYRNSMLIYGGTYSVNTAVGTPEQQPLFADRLIEYSPTQGSWTTVETKGTSPGKLTRHCMVQAYGGRNLIVFGGSSSATANIVPQGDIYILDLVSMEWSQGKQANPSDFRVGMACSVAGDNFVVWGGTNTTKTLGSTIVYNLSTKQWTNTFILKGASNPGAASRKAAIAGGCAAATIVAGAAIGFVVYRRRKQRSIQGHDSLQKYQSQIQEATTTPGYDLDSTNHNPHGPTDPLLIKDEPRDPAFIPSNMEHLLTFTQEIRNPEYVPIVHFQGHPRTDPQYSDVPLQEPWRNPQGLEIPDSINEDEALWEQWIHQQQQIALYQAQQEQQAALLQQQRQQYLDDLERLRRELEQLQSS
ncbi:hypothetical protein EC991_002070 [Linnemannia zychae]|nr:hypothetical protein EC991_002070 [Linnemannia zychae]